MKFKYLMASLFLLGCGASPEPGTQSEAPGTALPSPTELPVTPSASAGPGTVTPQVTVAPTPSQAPTPLPEDYIYYDPEHLLEVVIEMDAEDFAELSVQARSFVELAKGEDCLDEPHESPYTWFEADVRVDGDLVEGAGIRKKGFFGSSSLTKPGLKIKFDKFIEGQELAGMERLTLNNSEQDASLIHQCLSYQLFAAANVPASRCNFARVTVNGDYMGVYVHVEPVKKDMLKRHFPSNDGDLYEGAISDFREGWTGTFEVKTSSTDEERGPIMALKEALESPAATRIEAVSELLDIDAFLTYWATEVLVAQWDGYAANNNNYYVYRDPELDKMYFLPWGVDAPFGLQSTSPGGTASVYTTGFLVNKLYADMDTRLAYVERMKYLLNNVWDEAGLLEEVDRLEALLLPHAKNPEDAGEAMDSVRRFIRQRYDVVMSELDGAGPDAPSEPLDAFCWPLGGYISATFDGIYSTVELEEPNAVGFSTLDIDWSDDSYEGLEGSASVVVSDGVLELQLITMAQGGSVYGARMLLPQEWAVPGTYIIDGIEAAGILDYAPLSPVPTLPAGVIVDGELTFDSISTEEGGAVIGSFYGDIYEL